MSHTPGPWGAAARLGDDWDSVVYLPRASHMEICQCFHGVNKDECEANARLIAAAPEMYQALQALAFDALEKGTGPYELVQKVLAKAEGRQ